MRKKLLEKLINFGEGRDTLQWFRSYLSDRYQYGSVYSAQSEFLPIMKGVPQGLIQGPILFFNFIDDSPNTNSFFKFILFADESTLSCKTNSSTITEGSF